MRAGVPGEGASKSGRAQVEGRNAGACCPAGMGNVHYIWPMSRSTGRRSIERAVQVVQVVKAVDGPCRPGKQGAGRRLLVPGLELLDEVRWLGEPIVSWHSVGPSSGCMSVPPNTEISGEPPF